MEMDGSTGSSISPAPFLLKTYEMVDDPLTSCIVSWSQTGRSFVVWNPPEFARDLLPNYFKHNNFSSFIRQLNTYGFRKVDPDQWEFANEHFIKGQIHQLIHIHRRKPVHSHSGGQGSSVPVSASERAEFEEEIERLKQDKLFLVSALEKYKHENQVCRNQLKLLAQTLLDIELRQPDYSKKRRTLAEIGSSLPLLEMEAHGINKIPSRDLHVWSSFNAVSPANNEGIAAEMAASSESNISVFPSPDDHSCPNISSSYIGSPEISSLRIGPESRPDEFCGIRQDMKVAEDQDLPFPAGVNDVFWEQFLSEAPASSVSMEVL